MCPECGFIIGSNETHCENCYDFNTYYCVDYYADQDAEVWEELLDRLRDDDPDR